MLKIVGPWSQPSLPQERVKIRVVSHDRCVAFQIATYRCPCRCPEKFCG
jgi:hypothetical protein